MIGDTISLFMQYGIGTCLSSELGNVKAARKRSGTLISYTVDSLTATSPHSHWLRGNIYLHCQTLNTAFTLLKRKKIPHKHRWLTD